MTKVNGKVNAYNDFKGVGFIRREKGKDLFFSIDDFETEVDIDAIAIGKVLLFDVVKTAKGPRAMAIEFG
ncbi:cold shock domain-containing protein [Agarivorans aestuarii]|uniref:cold shock domain-containing protein n=1 Tax=Agarivorans aestuarii TaxID=1563703 RepID=UPI001C7F98F9|nr:cold shock domain-containing protein [Agarivorans aestuarii]